MVSVSAGPLADITINNFPSSAKLDEEKYVKVTLKNVGDQSGTLAVAFSVMSRPSNGKVYVRKKDSDTWYGVPDWSSGVIWAYSLSPGGSAVWEGYIKFKDATGTYRIRVSGCHKEDDSWIVDDYEDRD